VLNNNFFYLKINKIIYLMDLDFFIRKPKKKINSDIRLMLVEKYRPKNSDEIILDSFIKEKINKIIENKNIPNLIFTGENGTGKTSTISFLSKQIYENNFNECILELNAYDDRGLSIVSSTIYTFCKRKTDHTKLIILDEADSITPKAQNLLSSLLSEFKNSVRIVFICNDCSQIIEAIQSKCIMISFSKIPEKDILERLIYICNNENIKYTLDGLNKLISVSNGDIRQCINNMECINGTFENINIENVNKFIGKPNNEIITAFFDNCHKKNLSECLNIIQLLYNNGYTPNDILLNFGTFIFEKNKISESDKMKYYSIISQYYSKVNSGYDTFLQLIGCVGLLNL